MKIELPYSFFQDLCHSMADQIAELDDYQLVGVARAGLIPATIIAKRLRKPLAVFYPDVKQLFSVDVFRPSTTYIFIDDVYSQGRTYNNVKQWSDKVGANYILAPVVVDGKSGITPAIYGMITDTRTWIIFPWEEFDKAVEGDRGLFRSGTDKYAKTV